MKGEEPSLPGSASTENSVCRQGTIASRRPRRRCLRYSVRSLLVVMTLVGIYLGLETHRAIKQRKALMLVAKYAGHRNFDYERSLQGGSRFKAEPPGPKWLQDAVGVDYFRKLVSVSFENSSITDEDLQQFVDLAPDVRSLWLSETKVTDEGLRALPKLRKLRALSLDETAVTDEGLKYVAQCRQLLNLQLTRTNITDRGLENLRPIADHLIQIGLMGTQVTDEGIQALTESPECTLRWLNLGRTHVTDRCVEYLPPRLNLAFLNVQATQVTAEGAERLRQRFPQGEIICSMYPLSSGPSTRPGTGPGTKLFMQVREAIYE